MTYKIYKMTFQSAHFGDGTLDSTSLTFSADRLFSALVLEAIKLDQLSNFMELANQDDFCLTDAFPYYQRPFLPKPIGYPEIDKLPQSSDVIEMRRQAKQLKKLNYLEYDKLQDFLLGNYLANDSKVERQFAQLDYVTKNQPGEEGNLYQVGVTTFYDRVSLYVVANQSELLDSLMTSLQFSGLGGKRTSGYGCFDLTIEDCPQDFANQLALNSEDKVMTLTTCLPDDRELEQAMQAASAYLLVKSSGFAFSQEYSDNLRKQDLYKFKAGSTFSGTFKGQIVDVRPEAFPHPVWNYAKPLFYRLED